MRSADERRRSAKMTNRAPPLSYGGSPCRRVSSCLHLFCINDYTLQKLKYRKTESASAANTPKLSHSGLGLTPPFLLFWNGSAKRMSNCSKNVGLRSSA